MLTIAGEVNRNFCISLYDVLEIIEKKSIVRLARTFINQFIYGTGIKKWVDVWLTGGQNSLFEEDQIDRLQVPKVYLVLVC